MELWGSVRSTCTCRAKGSLLALPLASIRGPGPSRRRVTATGTGVQQAADPTPRPRQAPFSGALSAPLRDCSSVTDASAALIGQTQPVSCSDTTPRFIDARRLSSLDPVASNSSPCPCETIKVSGSPVSFRHPPPAASSHLLGRSCGLFSMWPVDMSLVGLAEAVRAETFPSSSPPPSLSSRSQTLPGTAAVHGSQVERGSYLRSAT